LWGMHNNEFVVNAPTARRLEKRLGRLSNSKLAGGGTSRVDINLNVKGMAGQSGAMIAALIPTIRDVVGKVFEEVLITAGA